MALQKVGLLSPGDMGHVVGRRLIDHGMSVITCLEGRSERTRGLAEKAGIASVANLGELVRDAHLILSVLVPAQAPNAAAAIAKAMKDTGNHPVYVDCNAIAPETARKMEKTILEADGRFVDAGIIGPPPKQKDTTRFYASGKDTREFEALSEFGLDVRVIGTEIGQASGLKMTYASLTKGIAALSTELLVSAWRMGLYEVLTEEFRLSQADRLSSMEKELPRMPSKARRWIGEMEEIAKTFEDLGLTPKIYEGAADIYRFVGGNPLADETAETVDKNRTLSEMVETLAKDL